MSAETLNALNKLTTGQDKPGHDTKHTIHRSVTDYFLRLKVSKSTVS